MKKKLKTHDRLTYISNTVSAPYRVEQDEFKHNKVVISSSVLIKLLVGLFLVSFGAADHIIMTRQESKLFRPIY